MWTEEWSGVANSLLARGGAIRLCFSNVHWAISLAPRNDAKTQLALLGVTLGGAVRINLCSPGRTRTIDREVNTAYYPVDRGRYPLLTRQDSESPTEGAAAFNLAFPQPCSSGFRFLQSMSCTTHGCAQRERLIHEASAGNSESWFHYSLHFQHSLKLAYLVKTS
jgi:hypothetical protein